MACQPRLDLPGVAQHVIQRGVDRQACFAVADDYRFYRQELGAAAELFGCVLHAYVLMTNHAHLLVTPSVSGAVSRMMQALSRRYVGRFKSSYRRTGTLWEGRFNAGLAGSEGHLLTCYRYIELNPVRARMVREPGAYPWSSYRCNAQGVPNSILAPHPTCSALGTGAAGRAAYRTLFAQQITISEMDAIRRHTQQQGALGSSRFRAQVEALTGRSTELRGRGRPAGGAD